MRLVPVVFVCLLMAISVCAQNGGGEGESVEVVEIALAKDDGSGAAGEEQYEFLPTDVPLHCSVLLDSPKVSSVRMDIVFLKAENATTGTKVVTVNFKSNGTHEIINFTGKPERYWKVGNYKVDIYLNGKLSKSKNFLVKPASASSKTLRN